MADILEKKLGIFYIKKEEITLKGVEDGIETVYDPVAGPYYCWNDGPSWSDDGWSDGDYWEAGAYEDEQK